MKFENGIVVLALDNGLASVAGFDMDEQSEQATLALPKLGPNLYAQVISITDDRQWSDSSNQAHLRMYLAACAFMAALKSGLEQRERIMRTLFDFLHVQEEQSGVQTPLICYLSEQVGEVDLINGERWQPAIVLSGMKAVTQNAPSPDGQRRKCARTTCSCASSPP